MRYVREWVEQFHIRPSAAEAWLSSERTNVKHTQLGGRPDCRSGTCASDEFGEKGGRGF
ncbi:hypothetical protein IE81DRAFT_322275 [Ceraceosorus guamensis]|uniref:Uncharacterized protein n=1 Tax=Ceraceosorus guamensis TaxID=1522189 RepID=A0A316W1C7_9BASI|nr:hypothetical protein IE81DRAFT_322275 [Ceraceosorus guamensis]PWN43620.1 hypothetical protein IE81DRAFT_322275 [Ceraceosorus guamensis]